MSDCRLYVNSRDPEEQRLALVCDSRLTELWIEHPGEHPGGKRIFLGRIGKVIPSLEAAFVTLGDGRDGLLSFAHCLTPPQTGQEVLVQVVKPPRKNKGPRLTARISFAGRFAVYLPCEEGVHISRKLSEGERRGLRELGTDLLPSEGGLILRTEALGTPRRVLAEEIDELVARWQEVRNKATYARSPALLWSDDDFVGRVLRDYLTAVPDEVVVDSPAEVERFKIWLSGKGGDGASVRLYQGADLFADEGLVKPIEAACHSRVPLPGGGELVIESTEALTAVDVNSAKGAFEGTAEAHMLAVNCEAADELARQVRLRNLCGLIVVDFIDLRRPENKQVLFERLKNAFSDDSEHVHLYPPSPLGLVELSRRRRRADLRGQLRQGVAQPEGGTRLRPAAQVAELKRLIRRACNGRPQALLAACSTEALELVQVHWWARWEEEFGLQIWLRPLEEFRWGGCRIEVVGSFAAVAERAGHSWGGEVPRVYRRDDP